MLLSESKGLASLGGNGVGWTETRRMSSWAMLRLNMGSVTVTCGGLVGLPCPGGTMVMTTRSAVAASVVTAKICTGGFSSSAMMPSKLYWPMGIAEVPTETESVPMVSFSSMPWTSGMTALVSVSIKEKLIVALESRSLSTHRTRNTAPWSRVMSVIGSRIVREGGSLSVNPGPCTTNGIGAVVQVPTHARNTSTTPTAKTKPEPLLRTFSGRMGFLTRE